MSKEIGICDPALGGCDARGTLGNDPRDQFRPDILGCDVDDDAPNIVQCKTCRKTNMDGTSPGGPVRAMTPEELAAHQTE